MYLFYLCYILVCLHLFIYFYYLYIVLFFMFHIFIFLFFPYIFNYLLLVIVIIIIIIILSYLIILFYLFIYLFIFFCYFRCLEGIVMWITKPFLVLFTSIVFFPILWKSVATSNCLITNILQNIFFYVQLKKETGLEQHEVE